MKFYIDNIKIPVVKCKKPKFSSHRGRTWDSGRVLVDNIETKVHLDTTWGEYIYFQYGLNLTWYKVKMLSSSLEDFNGKSWNIDPFSNPKSEIIIK